MCTLLIWKRQHPRFGIVAAANRDEYLDRPATPPLALQDDPRIVGGRDELGGGTWLAASARGLLVAVTNRRGYGAPDAARRSRGLLVADIARSPSLSAALDLLSTTEPRTYNPFVLLVADANDAYAVHCADDSLRFVQVDDGAHAITNWDIDAVVPRKAKRALDAARGWKWEWSTPSATRREADDVDASAASLHAMLADHGTGAGDDALCVHREPERYGTRSSTIAFLGDGSTPTRLFHAEGHPCTSTLVDVSALLTP